MQEIENVSLELLSCSGSFPLNESKMSRALKSQQLIDMNII